MWALLFFCSALLRPRPAKTPQGTRFLRGQRLKAVHFSMLPQGGRLYRHLGGSRRTSGAGTSVVLKDGGAILGFFFSLLRFTGYCFWFPRIFARGQTELLLENFFM
ncbi:uncharacterized protein TM35_000051100 [Trypanosoma theileri]|uniref:Secreted protein n=1 Tax=Trypanosoma theileri TaxID=67003 RepID=A0A1X0P3J9_9TRYP|nr:uncharacterized protein TM35_000051100 [Trypanosoma theileri]ORC91514.1 hypothetical protein TM35_000051100 [Trypanosoma theileri]